MPHMNNFDISVFTNISKSHTVLARSRGNLHVLSKDRNWETANDVWKEPSNNKIAPGYVKAYRIAKKKSK